LKERLDILLVERRLVESRTKAQWLIKQGYVSINGEVITKPGKRVENEKEISLSKEFPYVGRGGLKLEAALESFLINGFFSFPLTLVLLSALIHEPIREPNFVHFSLLLLLFSPFISFFRFQLQQHK